MNDKPTNSSPKNLSGRTVAIIFSAVGAILIIVCLAEGAWQLAVGFLIAFLILPILLPIFYFFSNFLGLILIGIPVILIGRLCGRVLPERFKNFAVSQKLYPIVFIFPFLGLYGIMLIIFRDFVAVTAVLLTLGIIFGLPALVKWLWSRRKGKSLPIDSSNKSGSS
jgi:hypothetical protein